MGPLLLSRSVRRYLAAQPSTRRVCIFEQDAFYAIEPADVSRRFGAWDDVRDALLWRTIEERAVAVHYWNALSRDLPLVCGSLVHRLLERNCIVCTELPCVRQ